MLATLGTSARHYLAARRDRHLAGEPLRRYQNRRARQVIAAAVARTPFYRRHFAGRDLTRWRELPTIDKRVMMENFDTFTTSGVSRAAAMDVALESERRRDYRPTLGDLTVGLSSGTSGHRGLFVVDPWERAAWAGRLLAWVLPGLRRRPYSAALCLRSMSNLYDTVRSRLVDLRYYDLMTPLPDAVASLNAFQPDILVAPPSLLVMLAAERRANRLRAAPERVISVAEVLDPEDAARIGAAFGEPVHQLYQCTEGLLAATCREGVLHVLEDCVALQYEPLDDADAQRVTPVVTDLWRRTQPIIRYRLNDILVLNPHPCTCGCSFQRIERIEGRQDDIFYFLQDGGGVRPVFPDVMRRAVLLASPDIVDYEVVQERFGEVRIHAVGREDTPHETVAQLLRASVDRTLRDYHCQATAIEIVAGLPPTDGRAKRRRVRRAHS